MSFIRNYRDRFDRGHRAAEVHERLVASIPKHYTRQAFIEVLVQGHRYERDRAESCWREEFEKRLRDNAELLYNVASEALHTGNMNAVAATIKTINGTF